MRTPKRQQRQQEQRGTADERPPAFIPRTPASSPPRGSRRPRNNAGGGGMDPTGTGGGGIHAVTPSSSPPRRRPRPVREDAVAEAAPAPVPPPATPTTYTWKQRLGLEVSMEERADHLVHRLHTAAEHLLDTLFRYLSQLEDPTSAAPNNSTSPVGGMTLPASALGWLSSQLTSSSSSATTATTGRYRHHHVVEEWNTMARIPMIQDRLRLLKFLLPRVTHLRITRDAAWPPEILLQETPAPSSFQHYFYRTAAAQPPSRQAPPPPPEVLDTSTMSVVSGLTTEDQHLYSNATTTTQQQLQQPQGPTREAFLEYMQELQHHPMIDLQLFENLSCLVLEGIPPTWIVPPTATSSSSVSSTSKLQLLTMTRAACHSGRELRSILRISKPPQPKQQSSSSASSTTASSLTHLKLEHCAIGNWSLLEREFRYLPNLQGLSLAHNQLAVMPYKGLRQLSCLQKLDLSNNALESLEYAHCSLGQLRVLRLSHNQITSTVNGLDKLYSLEELYLDHNSLEELPLGLVKLPLLKKLDLRANPKLFKVRAITKKQYRKHQKRRLQLLEAFQQQRTPRRGMEEREPFVLSREELPILNGKATTLKEWKRIQTNAYTITTTTTTTNLDHGNNTTDDLANTNATTTTTTTIRRVQRKRKPNKAVIENFHRPNNNNNNHGQDIIAASSAARDLSAARIPASPSVTVLPKKQKKRKKKSVPMNDEPSANATTSMSIHAGFSLQDVLLSLHKPPPPAPPKLVDDSPNSESSHEKKDSKRDEPEEVKKDKNERKLSMYKPYIGPFDDLIPSSMLASSITTATTVSTDATTVTATTIATLTPKEPQVAKKVESTAQSTVDANAAVTKSETPKNTVMGAAVYKGSSDALFADLVDATNMKPAASGVVSTIDSDTNNNETNPFSQGNSPIKASSSMDGTTSVASNNSNVVKSTASIETAGSQKVAPSKPKVATIKLNTGATKRFHNNIFDADWDELVQQAADGLIPNGKIQTPVAALEQQAPNGAGKVFSPDVVELLPPASIEGTNSSTPLADNGMQTASGTENDSQPTAELGSLSQYGLANALPDHVYEDDSCISSLGTNRDDFPKVSKFQLAEDNAAYDGPEGCQNMNILKNLDLYFDTYVFPPSVPNYEVEEDEINDDEAWKLVSLRYPRIQLWPEDRRALEAALFPDPTQAPVPVWASNRERCVRVWEEEVIPCGRPAIRRLTPNRRTRLGFHGDQLYDKVGVPDPYSESRKVFVCLSTAAVYIVVCEDAVTANDRKRGIQKQFPMPIGEDASFRDAPWPHAVARHSYRDLQAISIGFEFQRLTLRFTNPTWRRTDPFVYVLLPCNKQKTVSLLQDIQRLAKEANEHVEDLVSDSAAVAIENDSQMVFDALAVSVAPDLVGTVLHYQIVQQRWKHGERGTVRRVCVVTDSKIFLMDEDYAADGHKTVMSGSSNSGGLADVTYRIVDEATLKQVAEVQAANADPRAITILINPLSRLSRTHRWRLLCRDSDGAERLVEDVRKALALSSDEGGL